MRPTRKRKLVDAVLGDWDVSIRHAYRFSGSTRPPTISGRDDQAGLEARMKEICTTRVQHGYRRVHVMVRGENWTVNTKKVCRIFNKLGLKLSNKSPKRRVKAKLRDDRQVATRPNQTWTELLKVPAAKPVG